MVYVLIYGYYIIPISKGKYICRNGIDKLLHFFKLITFTLFIELQIHIRWEGTPWILFWVKKYGMLE